MVYCGLVQSDYAFFNFAAGKKLGAGCYFSTTAGFASQEKYCPTNSNGERVMILVRVITGRFCLGKKSFKSPPTTKDESGCIVKYNSVTDNMENPQMFCVFEDAAAYPDYVIKFNYLGSTWYR